MYVSILVDTRLMHDSSLEVPPAQGCFMGEIRCATYEIRYSSARLRACPDAQQISYRDDGAQSLQEHGRGRQKLVNKRSRLSSPQRTLPDALQRYR